VDDHCAATRPWPRPYVSAGSPHSTDAACVLPYLNGGAVLGHLLGVAQRLVVAGAGDIVAGPGDAPVLIQSVDSIIGHAMTLHKPTWRLWSDAINEQ
jgi:hypothetical protein